jgi:hypothetical protein
MLKISSIATILSTGRLDQSNILIVIIIIIIIQNVTHNIYAWLVVAAVPVLVSAAWKKRCSCFSSSRRCCTIKNCRYIHRIGVDTVTSFLVTLLSSLTPGIFIINHHEKQYRRL